MALAREGLPPTFKGSRRSEVEDECTDIVVGFCGGLDKNDPVGSYPCMLSTQLAHRL